MLSSYYILICLIIPTTIGHSKKCQGSLNTYSATLPVFMVGYLVQNLEVAKGKCTTLNVKINYKVLLKNSQHT